jgi:hypothetical protein
MCRYVVVVICLCPAVMQHLYGSDFSCIEWHSMVFYLIGLYFICRFEEGERDFRKILELKPGHSSAGKELAQTAEARDTLAEAELFIVNEEFTKAGEALDRVVSYSPECSQVNSVT